MKKEGKKLELLKGQSLEEGPLWDSDLWGGPLRGAMFMLPRKDSEADSRSQENRRLEAGLRAHNVAEEPLREDGARTGNEAGRSKCSESSS